MYAGSPREIIGPTQITRKHKILIENLVFCQFGNYLNCYANTFDQILDNHIIAVTKSQI